MSRAIAEILNSERISTFRIRSTCGDGSQSASATASRMPGCDSQVQGLCSDLHFRNRSAPQRANRLGDRHLFVSVTASTKLFSFLSLSFEIGTMMPPV